MNRTEELDEFMSRYKASEVRFVKPENDVRLFTGSINDSYINAYQETMIQITMPESSLEKLIRLDKEIDEERYVINSNDTVFKAYYKYRDLLNLVRNDYKL